MPFLTNDPLPQCLQQSSAMGASTLGGHERDVSAIPLELSVSVAVSRVCHGLARAAEITAAIFDVLAFDQPISCHDCLPSFNMKAERTLERTLDQHCPDRFGRHTTCCSLAEPRSI